MKTVRLSHTTTGKIRKYQFRFNRTFLRYAVACLALIAAVVAARSLFLPTIRIQPNSRLIMLGDLNYDRRWDGEDLALLKQFYATPFSFPAETAILVDVNRDGQIDAQDMQILGHLYDDGDPYVARTRAGKAGVAMPMPREMFVYVTDSDYLQRPAFTYPHALLKTGALAFLAPTLSHKQEGAYLEQLMKEITSEAVRFSAVYEKRKGTLNATEQAFVAEELQLLRQLNEKHDYYGLLLELILLSEAGETLSAPPQSQYVLKVRGFGLGLRQYLGSPEYAAFVAGRKDYRAVFSDMERLYQQTFGKTITIAELPPPRDLTRLDNYVDRAVWQVYKTKARESEFRRLINYAQHDRRYLRAVAMTTQRHGDLGVRNHNLPMMLLFREAVRITGGDKKSAVGLLDEAIRIPLAWVKTIPRERLPSSVALESFLLPGNMEDGSDKSRHWNVFGGIALYKSPEESLDLALRREVMDAKGGDFTPELMTEFIRDTIANCFGIYHVVSTEPAGR
jgi:hypothetical protein